MKKGNIVLINKPDDRDHGKLAVVQDFRPHLALGQTIVRVLLNGESRHFNREYVRKPKEGAKI